MMRFDQCVRKSSEFHLCFISYNKELDRSFYKYPNKKTEDLGGCYVSIGFIVESKFYNLIWSK
jgi:hypothetical protein